MHIDPEKSKTEDEQSEPSQPDEGKTPSRSAFPASMSAAPVPERQYESVPHFDPNASLLGGMDDPRASAARLAAMSQAAASANPDPVAKPARRFGTALSGSVMLGILIAAMVLCCVPLTYMIVTPGLYDAYTKRGLQAHAVGNVKEADLFFSKALSEAMKRGEYSEEALNALLWHGKAQMALDHYDEAATAFQKVLSVCAKKSSYPALAAAADAGLGNICVEHGDYPMAASFFDSALQLRNSFPPHSPLFADILRGQGNLSLRDHRYKDAIELLKRSLEAHKEAGSPAGEYAAAENDLGHAFEVSNLPKEARKCYDDALAIRETRLAVDSPAVAESLACLSSLNLKDARVEEAQKQMERALEIYHKALGFENLKVSETQCALAAIYERQGRYEKAERLLFNALETRKSQLGADDPLVLHTVRLHTELLARLHIGAQQSTDLQMDAPVHNR